MKKLAIVFLSFAVAACSHLPFLHQRPPIVGAVEFDAGIGHYSSVSGMYRQDACTGHALEAPVHLSNKQIKAILAAADKSGFYKAQAELATDWADPTARPAHCAAFRLHVSAQGRDHTVRWDCGRDGSNTPPPQVAEVFLLVQDDVQSDSAVRALPWSRCGQ